MSYNLDINKNESNNKIINKVFKELLQELYVVFLDIEDHNTLRLNEFIHNTLLEYDLDPKNVFETMKINSQPDFSYSSLIGIFYQYGIGCEPDEIKAFEIFSNANEKKAFRWYMKLANDNEPRALYIVAKCYRDGVGTDKDLKEAIKWSVRYEESKDL
ncbi:3838_t:CDS:2 [Rhizophagus irregularis]|nr:3838_t:CDS:2 [Rhizophagus irregularis]